jgi:hypothetical protein
MKPAQFIRSASAVAIISLFAGCSTWDNMGKTNQGTTVGAASKDSSSTTSGTSMSSGTAPTSTARNTTNSGNNDIGTIATSPTYGGRTAKSAITAGEVAAQNYVAMNAQSSPTTTARSASPTSAQSSPSMQKVSDVRSAQQALKDAGYDVGPIDGKMGPKTAAALRKFQKDHGIQASGRLDSRTLAALGGSSGST